MKTSRYLRQELFNSNRMNQNNDKPMTRSEFLEAGRVPEFVQSIPTFNGTSNVIIWVCQVEEVMKIFSRLEKSSIEYNILTRSIARKIVGEAAKLLGTSVVLSDWETIKSNLLLHYKDRRSLEILCRDLQAIYRNKNESMHSFFVRIHEVYEAIRILLQTDTAYALSGPHLLALYEDQAIMALCKGLDATFFNNFLLNNDKPKSLADAFQRCCVYEAHCILPNQASYSHGNQNNMVPPQQYTRNNFHKGQSRQGRFPQNRNNGYNMYPQAGNFSSQGYVFPPNNLAQNYYTQPYNNTNHRNYDPSRNLQYPEPMEVDPSLRTNFTNQPDQKRARPASSQQRSAYPIDLGSNTGPPARPEADYNQQYQPQRANMQPPRDEAYTQGYAETNFLDHSAKW